jgi:hypothetical protein
VKTTRIITGTVLSQNDDGSCLVSYWDGDSGWAHPVRAVIPQARMEKYIPVELPGLGVTLPELHHAHEVGITTEQLFRAYASCVQLDEMYLNSVEYQVGIHNHMITDQFEN